MGFGTPKTLSDGPIARTKTRRGALFPIMNPTVTELPAETCAFAETFFSAPDSMAALVDEVWPEGVGALAMSEVASVAAFAPELFVVSRFWSIATDWPSEVAPLARAPLS